MSLIQLFKKKSKVDLFTTPSHSQELFLYKKFRQFYKYDISETDAHNPQDALALAQKKASEIYKTKSTHFLTNGSTSGIIAAILACVEKDEEVLVWKDSHVCHQNAVKLAGGIPVFYEVKKDEEWGIFKCIEPKTIENKLKTQKIKAVIVTSPNYEGIVSDISAISGICKKYGAYLIVDEAHGALYPFCDKLPTSAIYQGADFVIQSLHKTAGGLNPTALLHCNVGGIDIDGALKQISTTSPSYPLLATIEKNVNYLNSKRGRKNILELVENIEKMKKNLTNCEFYDGDTTKILVKIPELSGSELSELLFEKYKIEDEICNDKSVMLLTGVGTHLKKLKRLEQALKNLKSAQ
jgi:lysine decarboxylase